MLVLDTVRVAAVQATPVILDAEASVDKAMTLAWRLRRGVNTGRDPRRKLSC
jgi:hypothetical protein